MNLVNPYRFATAGGDPYFNDVVLLAHMNGSNGGTTFPDNSNSAHTITAFGNAQTSTAQSVFNGSSASFDGTYDYLTIPDSDDWHMGSGDFTVEFFVRPTSVTGARQFVAQRTSSASYCPFTISANGSAVSVLLSFNNSSWAGTPTIQGGTLTVNTWHYIALTRSGSNFRLWLDGVQVGSDYTSSNSFTNSANLLSIGGVDTFSTVGNMAELRITKGVARDVSTTPTAPFPDS